MKVLFLANMSDQIQGFHNIEGISKKLNCSAMGLDYPLSLLAELAKYATVDVYSPPLQSYVKTMPLAKHPLEHFSIGFYPQSIAIPEATNAEQLLAGRDYDIVIAYAESIFSYLQNFGKIKTRKALWFLSSPQQILLPTYTDFFSANSVDLVLKVADGENHTDFGRRFIALGVKTEWLPLSVDANRFRNLATPKFADICLLGNLNPVVYPLRVRAVNCILMEKRFRVILTPRFGEEYVKAINNSRLFLTCSGIWKFPVMKYYEAMACGTLLLADDPMDAEALGFKADENYVSLDRAWFPKVENPSLPLKETEWQFDGAELLKLVDQHITRVAEGERMAQKAEQLIKVRHTNEVRVKELYEILEACM